MNILGKGILGGENSKGKYSEMGVNLVSSRSIKNARLLGTQIMVKSRKKCEQKGQGKKMQCLFGNYKEYGI